MKKNPYEPLTPEELTDKANEKKAIVERMAGVIENARACLDDPKFKKYRDSYEDLRTFAFKQLNNPTNPDPIQDAYYLRSCINTILVLDILLKNPEQDLKTK
jgi:hypothetical protein